MKNSFKIFVMLSVFAGTSFFAYGQHGKYVGGDISLLPAFEQHNSPYLDGNNQPISDLLTWLVEECGWNTFRVRLFVDPDRTDPSVCQDLEYVKRLGKRIKDVGAYFMLDYHYSDTWVDAGHIQAPRAWKNLSIEQKADSLDAYTRRTLKELAEYGATPDLVQVGNEIMYGFMGVKIHPYVSVGDDWDGYLSILLAGCRAVRQTLPNAQIIIHTDRPAYIEGNRYYYQKLIDNGVDFDIIGLSYYPFWHGHLSDLKKGLTDLNSQFPDKKVQIVETGYYFQYWPTSGVNTDTRSVWQATPLGQYNCIKDIIALLTDFEQVDGLLYWEPEDAGNGDDTNWNTSNGTVASAWTNRGLWSPAISNTGHKPITCTEGMAHYLFREFLDTNDTSLPLLNDMAVNVVSKIVDAQGNLYIVCGNRIFNPLGIEIK